MVHSIRNEAHPAKEAANIALIRRGGEIRDKQRRSRPNLDLNCVLFKKLLVTGLGTKSLFLGFEFNDGDFRIPILSMEHLDIVDGATLSKS